MHKETIPKHKAGQSQSEGQVMNKQTSQSKPRFKKSDDVKIIISLINHNLIQERIISDLFQTSVVCQVLLFFSMLKKAPESCLKVNSSI